MKPRFGLGAVLLVAALSWWNSRLLPRHNRTETVISAGTNAGGAAKTAEVNVADNSADEPILMADSEAGDFTLLPGSLPQETEDAAIVRVRLQRSALGALGLPVNEERAADWLQVDLLVGEDGQPRAVRLPNEVNN